MKYQNVKFYDSTLLALLDEDGTIWVAVKPIIDAIGLHGDSAVERIKKDEILADVHGIRQVRDSKNRLNDMLCLPIQWVNGWLFAIETNKVKPEIRAKLILYKKECYKVLHDAFTGKTRKVIINSEQRFLLLKELDKLKTQKYGIEQRMKEIVVELNNLDTDTFIQLNLFKAPDMDMLTNGGDDDEE